MIIPPPELAKAERCLAMRLSAVNRVLNSMWGPSPCFMYSLMSSAEIFFIDITIPFDLFTARDYLSGDLTIATCHPIKSSPTCIGSNSKNRPRFSTSKWEIIARQNAEIVKYIKWVRERQKADAYVNMEVLHKKLRKRYEELKAKGAAAV
jgi:hypothetical protein